MVVGMAANPQGAHQVGRHMDRPHACFAHGEYGRAPKWRIWRTPVTLFHLTLDRCRLQKWPRPEAGPMPGPQLGGFQMMTFFEGSSPGALAMLP